jgi:sugar phosphate isomerase/epimerase
MRSDRRDFLKLACAGTAAMALPGWFRAPLAGARRLDRIGLQLYTVRGLMEKDFAGTIAQVGEIGYREVEFAGYFDHTAAQVRSILDAAHLTGVSTHISLADTDAEWQKVLDDAKAIGCSWVVVAWIDDKYRTADGFREVAHRFNHAAELARKSGLGFAYHNHDFEFKPVDGKLPIDILLAESDRDLVKFEMDIYWFTKGGGDPLAYFRKWPGRFPLVHVKDMAPGPEQKMADVGAGKIDWKTIFQHSRQAGIEHYFVEYDDPPDPMASIRASYRYLKQLDF